MELLDFPYKSERETKKQNLFIYVVVDCYFYNNHHVEHI